MIYDPVTSALNVVFPHNILDFAGTVSDDPSTLWIS